MMTTTMTNDEIIRMARDAGLMGRYPFNIDQVERFAALVAAHERKACAKYVDHILKEGSGTYGDAIRARGEK